ncbi:MAG TPA: hypothetical protein EYP04_12525 [Anaerolineae bacterium]|nr:hypothetical protein [Anaerolineae bacterium]HIQ05334.1 hypothetical protein [Anaerolineae bacterium]
MEYRCSDHRIRPLTVWQLALGVLLIMLALSGYQIGWAWPMGGQAALLPPNRIGGASGSDQRAVDIYPAVAYDPASGQYLAVWMTVRNAHSQTDGFDVYGVFLDTTGQPTGNEFRISDRNTAALNGFPTVVTGDREFVVAWTARESSCKLYVQRVTDASSRPDHLLVSDLGHNHSPSLAYNPARQRYVLAFVHGDDYLPPTLFGAQTADCGNNPSSTSRIRAVEFHFNGNAPVVDAQLDVSDVDGGGFRPRLAYSAGLDQFLVAWEDRRSTSGQSYRFDVYAQRLTGNMTPLGTDIVLASGGDYTNDDTSATWTPRPDVAGGSQAFLTSWFAREVQGDAVIWSVVGRLVPAGGSPGTPFPIAAMTLAERHPDQAPTGFLTTAYNNHVHEFLVSWTSYLESLWGYLSFALAQRVGENGDLLNLDGSLRSQPGVGYSVDYEHDDKISMAMAVNPQTAGGKSEYLMVYGKHAPHQPAQDFDIWGVRMEITGALDTPTATPTRTPTVTAPPTETPSPTPTVTPTPTTMPAAGAVRVAYLYAYDGRTAVALRDFLEGTGEFSVTLLSATDGPLFGIYLPILPARGSFGQSKASVVAVAPRSPTILDVDGYDVYVIGPDTGNSGVWYGDDAVMVAIAARGKPVIGLGAGGFAFFGELGLPIGYPNGSPTTASAVQAADLGQSRSLYEDPNPISLPPDQTVTLYTAPQQALAANMPSRVPGAVRMGALPGDANRYPLAQAGARFLLWGFAGGPDRMTSAGRNLFINVLWFGNGDVVVPLRSGAFVPPAGFDPDFLEALAASEDGLHALAQLDHIPDTNERTQLEAGGVHLLTYLAGTVYAVKVDKSFNSDDAFMQGMIRWLGGYQDAYKIAPELSTAAKLEEARAAGIEKAVVVFFADVSRQEAEVVLQRHTKTYEWFSGGNDWLVPSDASLIADLAAEETVRWIGPGPVPPGETNDEARQAIGTDSVTDPINVNPGPPTYLGLIGRGVTVAQFERKPDETHDDLSGRIIFGGGAHADYSDHATHVAGIIGGNGSRSDDEGYSPYQYRGHAPAVRIVSESYGDATVDLYDDAYNEKGAEVSNHSYVQTYGVYDDVARGVDRIVRGDAVSSGGRAVPARLAVWAACNQGASAQYDNEEGFYSIYSPAKNSLSVGSTNTDDNGLTFFSSKGPTFDGRIKPDVVAPGCENNFGDKIRSTSYSNSNGYTDKCGTSMAAPATTGVVALMLEQWHGNFDDTMPLPSTIKAILVNTATDLTHTTADNTDWNDPDLCPTKAWDERPPTASCAVLYDAGPDFATGYGLINAPRAVNTVRAKNFIEGELTPGDMTDEYVIAVPAGRDELRFTLAWDDEPGDASVNPADNLDSKLVNDLNLLLIGPDGNHFPWVLDPLPVTASPGLGARDPITQTDLAPAYRDVNTRDNVEQVVVPNPVAGNWTIRVSVNNLPTGQSQPYSLTGDFRTLNIVEPVEGVAADAGDPDNPNVILVMLEAQQPFAAAPSSSLVDATVADFSVRIGGTAADIVSGLAVGDQFWLNVKPQGGVYVGGHRYDLEVTWAGHGSDSEDQAILFTEQQVTDRAVIINHSGFMESGPFTRDRQP